MYSFSYVNKVRTSLKMKLSQHAWYQGSRIELSNSELLIKISVQYLNADVRRFIPEKVNDVKIRIEA